MRGGHGSAPGSGSERTPAAKLAREGPVQPMPASSIVETDRRAAIQLAVDDARTGDVVVVAGKGHETTQEVDGAFLPFDDREVAREALARRSAT